jgi:YgiT-type zinc finger domain-containing protein
MTHPFEKCPVCGGALADKTVEKLVEGGGNTARVKVRAEVCLRCGERLYRESTVRRFEDIRRRLRLRRTRGFRATGQAFEVVGSTGR